MRLGGVLCLAAAIAAGQNFEVRGVVVEPWDQPLAGVRITLSGPQAMQTGTDAQGGFRFQLSQPGTYRIEASKDGYEGGPALALLDTRLPESGKSATVLLNDKFPSQNVLLALARPGQISGTVVNDETGAPEANFPLTIARSITQLGRHMMIAVMPVATDSRGRFTAAGLLPGDYVAAVRPEGRGQIGAMDFSEEAATGVDEDYEELFWPGGAPLGEAQPLRLGSGQWADAGIVRVRKVAFRRVRLSLEAPDWGAEECAEIFVYGLHGTNAEGMGGGAACGRDILLHGFRPGDYGIYVRSTERTKVRAMGFARFPVGSGNTSVRIPLQDGIEIQGRIVAAEGAALPPLDHVQITAQPIGIFPNAQLPKEQATKVAPGQFRLRVLGGRQEVRATGIPAGHYVMETRYNGVSAPGGIAAAGAPGSLEIVVDDQPAAVTGSVSNGDAPARSAYVVLVKWPPPPEDVYGSVQVGMGDREGRFQFRGLAAGEYRIVAVPAAAKEAAGNPEVLDRLLRAAEKVTLTRGSVREVALRMAAP
jgi:Carboxypeptidase regulatory-like domain